jgi:alkylation response protein AidB-like acyl-CoA dehydrogenase
MASATGFDRGVWRAACDELGLASIHIPEVYGGMGFGHAELCIALEETGRALYCSPFFSSIVLASNAVLNGATEAWKQKLLPAIASGETLACLAFTEVDGSFDVAAMGVTARPDDGAYRLDGVKKFVIDGTQADIVIVAAQLAGADTGASLFVVDGNSAGLDRRALEVIDPTRRQALLEFTHVRAELIGDAGGADAALRLTLHQAAIALANEMAGGCQALLDAAVAYAKLRMQFGRLIGSFQAVKHHCADMLLDVEHAKSAAYYAAAALDARDPELAALAALAKAVASDAYMRTAALCIQIHGGIGFTWDNDTQLWFKRAKSSEVFLGTPAFHRERYLQALEVTS